MIHRAGLPPVLSCILLVLLSAPMIALGVLWAAYVLASVFQTPDVEDVRAGILVWMTIALVCSAISILAEVVVAPFVFRLRAK